MWILKGLLFLVFVIVLVAFAVQNSHKAVDIDFLQWDFLGISILWVVLISAIAGFALSFLIAAFREVRFRLEIRGLKKTLRQRDQEIAELRTLPLNDKVRTTTALDEEADDDE